jgi:hypothetical protein
MEISDNLRVIFEISDRIGFRSEAQQSEAGEHHHSPDHIRVMRW